MVIVLPPKAYNPLLNLLANQYILNTPLMRIFKCDVSKKSIKNWKILADDFIKLSTNNKSSEKIGVGHSMGGTILLYSAIKMPNFFSKIILLDPVIFTPFQCKMWRVINF